MYICSLKKIYVKQETEMVKQQIWHHEVHILRKWFIYSISLDINPFGQRVLYTGHTAKANIFFGLSFLAFMNILCTAIWLSC